MMTDKTFTIVGGDLRQVHMAGTLRAKESGYKIYGLFFDEEVKMPSRVQKSNDLKMILPQSDIVIFPLPLLDAKGYVNTALYKGDVSLEECLEYISPEAVILGGKIPCESLELAHQKGLELIDYYEREEFTVLNAVPTAEGAIEIAMNELPITLFGSNCLIVGYGRIAKILAKLLCAFGAKVTVAARKYSDLAWARINGCEAVHMSELGHVLSDVDVLFNTAPAMLLDEAKLSKLKRTCLVVDLASKPGGVDFDMAKSLGLKTIWALSLPGKVAPISAGEVTLGTVFNILSERGGI